MRLAFLFLKNSIDKLHTKYAKFYKKEVAIDAIIPDPNLVQLDAQAQEELKTIQSKINYYQPALRKINDDTLHAITQSAPLPESWLKELYRSPGKIKDADDVFKGYNRFLAQYKQDKDFTIF